MKPKSQRQEENVDNFLENGPGLRYSYNTWIIAKDPELGKVLVGGLGALGVGEMWLDDKEYKEHPDYADAPIKKGF